MPNEEQPNNGGPRLGPRKTCLNCDICGVSSFASKRTLNYHKKSHLPNLKSLLCEMCGISVRSRRALAIHKRIIHMWKNASNGLVDENKKVVYNCTLCRNVQTNSPRKLIFHYQDVHPNQEVMLVCQKQKKRKSKHAKLFLLLDENQNEITCENYESNDCKLNTIKCPFCQLPFSESRLKGHLMTEHPTKRNLFCTCCAMIFTDYRKMETHMMSHTEGQTPEKCVCCEAVFASPKALHAHSRLHTSERPFPCTVCSKGFSTKTGVIAHFHDHLQIRIMELNETVSLGPRDQNEKGWVGVRMVGKPSEVEIIDLID